MQLDSITANELGDPAVLAAVPGRPGVAAKLGNWQEQPDLGAISPPPPRPLHFRARTPAALLSSVCVRAKRRKLQGNSRGFKRRAGRKLRCGQGEGPPPRLRTKSPLKR